MVWYISIASVYRTSSDIRPCREPDSEGRRNGGTVV